MRFAAPAAALSLALALSASIGVAAKHEADPRAVQLVAEGRAALAADKPQEAIDAFEAALAVDPAHTAVYLELADAARHQGLQGKAITYYRVALERDPENLAAISGEGAALVEKGALERARRNLARLESLCGNSCPETRELASAIAQGPQPMVLTAEAIMPDAQVTKSN
ncbi:tetratricopeptide repeat protein [Leptolyngbya sp. 15MV]|nr:tetratricopeptide repeat protein [Leptolyngbya sp. 15MV]